MLTVFQMKTILKKKVIAIILEKFVIKQLYHGHELCFCANVCYITAISLCFSKLTVLKPVREETSISISILLIL